LKKFLILSSTGIVSGAEYVLIDYLKNSKFKDNFLILHSNITLVNNFYKDSGIKEIKCSFLNPVGAEKTKNIFNIIKKVTNFLFAIFCIIKVVKENNIDIILGNNTGDSIYAFYAKILNKKYINFIHDIIEKSSFLAFSIKFFDRFVDKYIVVSNAVKQSMVFLGIKQDKIKVIYNGLLPNKKIIIKRIKNYFKFGFVGYIDSTKNPEEFIEIIKLFADSGLNIKAEIITGSIVDKNIYYKILGKIKKYKLNINIIEKLPREKMSDFYHDIHFLIVTSRKEALPTVILEAFNNSTPVIGKNIGGISEIIKHNYNGLLYDDLKNFDKIIIGLKKFDIIKYKKMQRNCLKTIDKKFNLKSKITRLDKILFEE